MAMSAFVLERLRHVAGNDAPRETFDDRRLADAGLADEHRIVFRPAREHLHDAADFVVAADDRIDLAAPRQLGEVASVFFQRLIFALGILIGHALRTAHLLERLHQLVARHAGLLQQARAAGAFAFVRASR